MYLNSYLDVSDAGRQVFESPWGLTEFLQAGMETIGHGDDINDFAGLVAEEFTMELADWLSDLAGKIVAAKASEEN